MSGFIPGETVHTSTSKLTFFEKFLIYCHSHTNIIPILQVKMLRHREIPSLPKGS